MSSTRTRIVALVTLLQLWVQPLALAAGCALLPAGSADCCCSPSPEVTSCCASELSASEGEPATVEDCECAVVPDSQPLAPAEAVDRSGDLPTPRLARTFARAALSAKLAACPTWRSTRAPGPAPPAHLRFGVFLL